MNTSLGDRTFHVREAGQSFDYSLPGGAVATFKWPGPGSPTPPLTPPPLPAPLNHPHGGAAWTLPGTIQAEDYDEGGRGVAYADNDAGNNGGAYRTDDVDVEATGDAGGGYNVGWTGVGEWLKYTVDVAVDGVYDFNLRVAADGHGLRAPRGGRHRRHRRDSRAGHRRLAVLPHGHAPRRVPRCGTPRAPA